MPKIVAGYARVSTVEQATSGYSIDEQISRIKSYCDAMGWSLQKIYTDAGFSGASLDRPALQEMIQDIRDKKADIVLVYKLDRLSRSQKDALYLIEDAFLGHGIDFVSMSENFDTSSPFGRAMIGILAVFAQLEREQIKERMSLGKDARAKSGKWRGGGNVPVGYEYENGELIKNEYEAFYIERIFNWFTSGVTLKRMEIMLQEQNVTHKYGTFSVTSLRRILKNPVYAGNILRKGNIYPGNHEAIVSQETFVKAQEIFKSNTERWASYDSPERTTHLLAGIIFCGKCKARYHAIQYHKNGKHRYSCYSRDKRITRMIRDPNCKNKTWRVSVLDKIILDQIKSLSIDPDALKIIPEAKKEKPLKTQLEKLRSQRSKLMDLYSLGNMDLQLVTEKIEPLNQQISALEEQLKNQEQKIEVKKEMSDTLMTAPEIIDKGTHQQKRALVLSVISKIELNDDEINIYWKL